MRRALGLGLALSLIAKAALAVTIYLTAGTTWVVPSDFGPANTIEAIGAGGTGNVRCGLSPENLGGGGGAYAKVTGVSLVPGATINVHFGTESGGNAISGVTDGVWLGSSATIFAESGWDGGDCGHGGQGGRASASVGTTKFSGGGGGDAPGGGLGTAAGGGAAGAHGTGGDAAGTTPNDTGGTGDSGFGGAGGGPGKFAGANGTEFDGSHGSGGGGGASAAGGGAVGGLYGGGGGYLAAGKGGLIVITYTPRRRVSSGAF